MVPLGRLKLCLTSQYGLLDHIISLYVPQVEITRKMSANSPYPAFAWITSQLSDQKWFFFVDCLTIFTYFFPNLIWISFFGLRYWKSYFDLSVPFRPGWWVIILQLGCCLFSFLSQAAALAPKVFKNWRFYCIKFRVRSAQEQISKLSPGAKSGENLGLQQTINLALDAIASSVKGTIYKEREGRKTICRTFWIFAKQLKSLGAPASSWQSGFGPLEKPQTGLMIALMIRLLSRPLLISPVLYIS